MKTLDVKNTPSMATNLQTLSIETQSHLIQTGDEMKAPRAALITKFVTLFTALSLSASAFAGGVDTGGGTIATYNNQPALIDLIQFAPELLSQNQEEGVKIQNSRSLKKFGIDRLDLNKYGFEQTILNKISPWEDSSPTVTHILKSALSQLRIYVVNYNLISQASENLYFKNPSVDLLNPQLAAFYIKDFGVYFSKKTFEELSYTNQTALITHELIRHIQLTYAYSVSDEKLQKLTSKLMKGPQGFDSLERKEIIDQELLTVAEKEPGFIQDVNTLKHKACKYVKNYNLTSDFCDSRTVQVTHNLGKDLNQLSLQMLELRIKNGSNFYAETKIELSQIENDLDLIAIKAYFFQANKYSKDFKWKDYDIAQKNDSSIDLIINSYNQNKANLKIKNMGADFIELMKSKNYLQ